MVVDSVSWLNKQIAEGKRILIEGANAIMLDIDFGTYPNVCFVEKIFFKLYLISIDFRLLHPTVLLAEFAQAWEFLLRALERFMV